MRPKSFHHFIIAGVIAMASAGLVTVNGSSLARTIRLADMSQQMRGPGSVTEMRGTAAGREFAPQYPLMPQDNDPKNRQDPPLRMTMPETRQQMDGGQTYSARPMNGETQVRMPEYQNRDVPAMQREGTAGGSAMPQSLGMDFLKKMMLPPGQMPVMHTAPQMNEQNNDQQKMMLMKEEMLKKSAGEGSMSAPSQSAAGEGTVQSPAMEKDMIKQFGGMGMNQSVMQDIMQQLRESNQEEDDTTEACDTVELAVAEMLDQATQQSAKRVEIYTANRDKTTSAAVKKVWQKRIDTEATKLAAREKQIDAKAQTLREKYGCTTDEETDL